jgi:hypothetical protein
VSLVIHHGPHLGPLGDALASSSRPLRTRSRRGRRGPHRRCP